MQYISLKIYLIYNSMPNPFTSIIGIAFLILLSPTSQAQEKPPEIEIKLARSADEFLILPLKIYRLKAADVPDVDSLQLKDSDIHRILAKVNTVWAAAGIYWQLESIENVNAENLGRLKLLGLADAPDSQKKPHLAFRDIIPESTRKNYPGYRVYFIHDFDVNGVYFGRREAMVKETAALRPVEGGIDEPIPRVTSHELGHGLGLPHRQDRLNLMASGTTGTLLNTNEIAKAREFAAKNPACLKYNELQKKMSVETDPSKKKAVLDALNAIETLGNKSIHPVRSSKDAEIIPPGETK